MGLYIKDDDVKIRLLGKVRFTDDENEENKFQNRLLKRLISEAEADVEHDMSPRYMAPFQTDDALAFAKLPARPTQEIIRTLCELKSVIRVLETDFGRGSVVNGEEYAGKQRERYKEMLAKQLQRREDSYNQWFYPPLPGLKLNYMNNKGDDGFSGQILVTSDGLGDFPSKQINSPGENYWNGKIDPND